MVDISITAARFFQFAAVFVLFGSPLFYLYAFDTATEPFLRRQEWPRTLLFAAALVGIGSSFAWLMAETTLLNDDVRTAFNPSDLWTVITETHVGKFYVARTGLLLLAATALAWRPLGKTLFRTVAVVGGALTASFAWTGHGNISSGLSGLVHLGSDVVHLLAAGIWIGALVPLSVILIQSLRTQDATDARAAHRALARFSGIGPVVVSLLVLSGLVNSWFLVGPSHWQDLYLKTYGLLLLAKMGMFLGMLVLATANRFYLTPRLAVSQDTPGETSGALTTLRISVIMESTLAGLVLAAVAILGNLEPITSA
jgi:putative copper resistance protein D